MLECATVKTLKVAITILYFIFQGNRDSFQKIGNNIDRYSL